MVLRIPVENKTRLLFNDVYSVVRGGGQETWFISDSSYHYGKNKTELYDREPCKVYWYISLYSPEKYKIDIDIDIQMYI